MYHDLSREEILELIEKMMLAVEYRKYRYVVDDDELFTFYNGEFRALNCLRNCILDIDEYNKTLALIQQDIHGKEEKENV